MAHFITQALHIPQALLSGYSLYLSYSSIQNLRQYEEKSEKAAEWSNTAATQLHKTRTTQASAAISVRPYPFICSLSLSLSPLRGSRSAASERRDTCHNADLLTVRSPQVLFSFSSSLLLAFAANSIPSIVRYTLSPAVLLAVLFSRSHVADFWASKAKVPLVDGFNDAISSTKEILQLLQWLEWSWVGVALVGAICGY